MKRLIRSYATLALLIVLAAGSSRLLRWAYPETVLAQQNTWPEGPYPAVNVNFSGATATLIAAPSTGALCIYGLSLSNAGAASTTISIYQDGGTTAVGSIFLPVNGAPYTLPFGSNAKLPYFVTNLQTGFVVKSSGSVQVNGTVYGQICP